MTNTLCSACHLFFAGVAANRPWRCCTQTGPSTLQCPVRDAQAARSLTPRSHSALCPGAFCTYCRPQRVYLQERVQPRLELSTLPALHKIKKLPLSRSWQRVLDSDPLHAPLAAIDMRRFRDIQGSHGLTSSVRLA